MLVRARLAHSLRLRGACQQPFAPHRAWVVLQEVLIIMGTKESKISRPSASILGIVPSMSIEHTLNLRIFIDGPW